MKFITNAEGRFYIQARRGHDILNFSAKLQTRDDRSPYQFQIDCQTIADALGLDIKQLPASEKNRELDCYELVNY